MKTETNAQAQSTENMIFAEPIYSKIYEALHDEMIVSNLTIDKSGCCLVVATFNDLGDQNVAHVLFDYDLSGRNLLRAAVELSDSFDVDTYVYQNLDAKKNGVEDVPSAAVLVEQAERIESFYSHVVRIIKETIEHETEAAP